VSIAGLVKEIQSSTSHDLESIRKRMQEEFTAATTNDHLSPPIRKAHE
jgi:hypothetical protein